MLLRRLGTSAGLLGMLLLGLLLLGAAPANAEDEPAGWLELDAGPAGEVHRLTPGDTADWAVDVQVRGETASALELKLEPGSDSGLRDFLSVELRSCEQPWDGGGCAQGQRSLLAPTELKRAEGLRINLMQHGSTTSRGTYVLLTAALAEDVPKEVQGSRTQLAVDVYGSWADAGADAPGAVAARPDGPPSTVGLADTGARVGGFAVLGALTVAVGFGLARLRGARA